MSIPNRSYLVRHSSKDRKLQLATAFTKEYMIKLLFVAVFAILLNLTYAFQSTSRININSIRRIINSEVSSTALYAHHPQKKIIKKKQDQRPKKHRLSDINRTNVNLNKCITKVLNAPS